MKLDLQCLPETQGTQESINILDTLKSRLDFLSSMRRKSSQLYLNLIGQEPQQAGVVEDTQRQNDPCFIYY